MTMNYIADVHNWHRFRSVQLGLCGGACGAALTAYGAALAIAPDVVSGVPHWLLTVLVLGSMAFPFASTFARALAQPNLPPIPPRPINPITVPQSSEDVS